MGLCRVLEADPLLRTGALMISTGRVNKVAGNHSYDLVRVKLTMPSISVSRLSLQMSP
jgi:hypothetical protein